jgi:hypothetical protein
MNAENTNEEKDKKPGNPPARDAGATRDSAEDLAEGEGGVKHSPAAKRTSAIEKTASAKQPAEPKDAATDMESDLIEEEKKKKTKEERDAPGS